MAVAMHAVATVEDDIALLPIGYSLSARLTEWLHIAIIVGVTDCAGLLWQWRRSRHMLLHISEPACPKARAPERDEMQPARTPGSASASSRTISAISSAASSIGFSATSTRR